MKVIVDAGAWQLAMNVLRRDAADGMHVRAEIVEEMEKATVSLSDEWRLVPKEANRKMLDAAERVDEDGYHAMWDAMLSTAPEPPNAAGKADVR